MAPDGVMAGPGGVTPRLFDMSRFRHGVPAEVYESITGMKLDELRRHVATITYETLAQAMALGVKSFHGRRVGKPRKLEVVGGTTYLRLEPNLAISMPTSVAMEALGVGKTLSVEAVHAMREAFKDSVRIVEINGMAKLGRGVIALEAGRVYAVVVREAKPHEPEYQEAMAIIDMLEHGQRDKALSMLFGIPASHGLLRVFLPRFLTLIMPTRPYGHELTTQACPTVLQIHPPGTGKSRFSDIMVNLMPSTAMVVGSASRVSMIYDGQLKAPGMVYKYRHIIRDEFATAPMSRDKARDLEGALKHGIISGEWIWAAEGSRGRMIKARNELYMRWFSNHVRIARGSRIEYKPSSPHETLHEAIATIFARLGFAEGMAWARRFTRLDVTRTGRHVEGVSDGMQALRQPTGMVVYPKVLVTVVSWLRRRPDVLARWGILVKKNGKYMPRLRDEINTSSTLAWLDDWRHDLVEHVLEARRQSHEIPGTDMRLEHVMPASLLPGHDSDMDSDMTATQSDKVESEAMAIETDMYRLKETPDETKQRHDDSRHVWLVKAEPPAWIVCFDDTCYGFRGPLSDMPEEFRHAVIDVIRHGSSRHDGGEEHDERSA